MAKAKAKASAGKPKRSEVAVVTLLRGSLTIKGTLIEVKVLSDGGTEVSGVLKEISDGERRLARQAWDAAVAAVGRCSVEVRS